MLLEFLDGRRQYARVLPSKDLVVSSNEEGVRIWDHKDVKGFFVNKAMTWKPSAENAVFIPCAWAKPYLISSSHRQGYLQALQPFLDRIDLFVVSEPMTIVPYCYSDEYPIAYYDFNPYNFDSDSARAIFMDRVGTWIQKYHPRYKKRILILTWQYREKFLQTLSRVQIPHTEYLIVSFQGSPENGQNPTAIRDQVQSLLTSG